MPREDWLVVGISGATCSGKTTVAKTLNSLLTNSVLLLQDDFFYETSSEKHIKLPELNHINFEVLTSVDMDSFKSRIRMILNSESSIQDSGARRIELEKCFREKFATSEIVPSNECLLSKIQRMKHVPNVLILDGFLIFNDEELRELCDVKFYFTLDRTTCRDRRKNRVYDPPDVPGYFEKYVWPHYIIHYEEVLKKASNVKFVNGADSVENNFVCVLHKLLTILS